MTVDAASNQPTPSPNRVSFGARLADAVRQRGPLCVGIDPHPQLLRDWDLPVTVDGLKRFALDAVDGLGPTCSVVKPQSAFFEAFGSAGIAVLEQTIARCSDAGALVLLDVKRGDIGSTMDAYARAYLADGSPLAVDAITVSGYLGVGSLTPALDLAERTGRGVFMLALTSNPEGPQVQRAIPPRPGGGNPAAGNPADRPADSPADAGQAGMERTVAQQVIDAAAARNAGDAPMGSIGVVIGATLDRLGVRLDELNGPILAPGFGAQGGTVDSLRSIFGDALRWVLPSSSREVLAAGPDPAALAAAARRLGDDLARAGVGWR